MEKEQADSVEHVLIRDDDGHWYVCPADKEDEVKKYFEALFIYWDSDDGVLLEKPSYLVAVGGAPSLVKFTGYRIG